MIVLVGIAGSLRSGSLNAKLLASASELAPNGCRIEELSLREIPLYDGDLEAQGIPAGVSSLKERVLAADGLLLVSPEYNNSMPGVMKNALDWLSRPPGDIGKVFGGRPVGLIGATPGAGGTRFAQAAWLPVFRTLGMRPWFGGAIYMAGAHKLFDAQGKLTDQDARKRLARYMSDFTGFVAAARR
ncbi:NADPH-dependent FMN reductase [soil metagenome]